jgi:hypothetical protein
VRPLLEARPAAYFGALVGSLACKPARADGVVPDAGLRQQLFQLRGALLFPGEVKDAP